MSKGTPRPRSSTGHLSEIDIPNKPISISADANAPHGERGDFLKVTATLSPEVYKLVSDEAQRRKLAHEPNAQMSAILREAVLAYLAPSRRTQSSEPRT